MRVLMLVECVWTGGCSTGGRHLVAATVADGDMATAFKPWKPSTALYLSIFCFPDVQGLAKAGFQWLMRDSCFHALDQVLCCAGWPCEVFVPQWWLPSCPNKRDLFSRTHLATVICGGGGAVLLPLCISLDVQ